jgi:dihydrofolate synthase/folylpolyglutamate synthase
MSPHILTYNERITLNQESIPNNNFTEIGNNVISMAESLNIEAHSDELLTMMALLFFVEQKVDVALMEVSAGGTSHPVNICSALVATVTRITPDNAQTTEDMLAPFVKDAMGIVKKGTWFVSGDQCKAHLEIMQEATKAQGGNWVMPIRKVAPLTYPLEQLHGRCAALAERVAVLFMEHFHNKHVTITADTLLSKKEGKRGRPTLVEKRKSEQHPKVTLDQFWRETVSELPAKFQILEKERPPVLLDTASNIDALSNLLLGIRLTHYERSLKGLAIIMAASKESMHSEEFLRNVRYFFKKTSGTILICPLEDFMPGLNEDISWDVEKVTNDIKSMKIKARACKDFKEAFDAAEKLVDEKQGLIVITGSHSIIHTYWRHKGIKKL